MINTKPRHLMTHAKPSLPAPALAKLLMVSLLLVGGCAGNPQTLDSARGVFVTYIAEDGSKRFQYTVNGPKQQHGPKQQPAGQGEPSGKGGGDGRGQQGSRDNGGHGQGKGGKPGGDPAVAAQLEKQMVALLVNKLRTSGYCRNGFFKLNSVYTLRGSYIRGECDETATADDKVKFVNLVSEI